MSMQRQILVALVVVGVAGLIVTASQAGSGVPRSVIAQGATCAAEGMDQLCQPLLHRIIPPHSRITLAARNRGVCGPLPAPGSLCTPPTPPVVVINNADVTALVDENRDLGIVSFTYPFGFIAGSDSGQCVVNERENVASCPVGSVSIDAMPETFTTSPLPENTWELVSNPFDVPVSVSLGGPGELWTWDGSQYNAATALDPHQAAWAISYLGGSLQFTAQPPPAPACPPAGCPP